MVEGPDGFERVHVINRKKISVGSRLRDDLRLRRVPRGLSFQIEQKGPRTFEVSRISGDTILIVNSYPLQNRQNLKAGDWISLGENRIQFAFAKESAGL